MNELIKLENGQLTKATIEQIIALKKQKKAIDEADKKLNAALIEVMEENKILKLETPELNVTYIAPTTAEKFDSKTFKVECPEAYDAYVKLSPVSASVRVKIHEG